MRVTRELRRSRVDPFTATMPLAARQGVGPLTVSPDISTLAPSVIRTIAATGIEVKRSTAYVASVAGALRPFRGGPRP